MSPERIEQLEYSYPSDVWSLGITLLFAATGKSPYEGQFYRRRENTMRKFDILTFGN